MTAWYPAKKPLLVMAPMADVTDPAFRALVARFGKADITYTEFVSADGLFHTREKQGVPDEENPLMRDLSFNDAERPVIAQFFSAKPEMMAYAAALAEKLGFDGVDINMGCPDRSVEKQGGGAAMIKTPEVAAAVIRAAQGATRLPVSVKTRIGYAVESLAEWLPVLLAEKPAAITLHLRTKKELSLVPAHWELMEKAVFIRNRLAPETLLIGNGDVKGVADAYEKCARTGADGAMIGRALFGNPWVFAGRASEDIPLAEKLDTLVALAHEFEALRPTKHFAILKKHIKAFVTGFPEAAALRAALMEAENASELAAIIERSELR